MIAANEEIGWRLYFPNIGCEIISLVYSYFTFTEVKNIFSIKFFSILIFILSNCFSQAQTIGNLLTVKQDYQSPSSFVEINPSNGQTTLISNLSIPSGHSVFVQRFLDVQNNRFFLVTADSVNVYLMNFDIASGQLNNILFTADSVGNGQEQIGGSPDISSPFYNCVDGNLYFFRVHTNSMLAHLMKVDLNTLAVTQVHVFQFSNFVKRQAINIQNQKIYMLSFTDPVKLLTYDLSNGVSNSISLSPGLNSSDEIDMIYNPTDGNLYGMEQNYTNFNGLGKIRILKINPDNGVVTFSETFQANIFFFNQLELSPTGDNLFFLGTNTNPSYNELLFNYNLRQNTFTTQVCDMIGGPLDFYFNPVPDTSFIASNFCQHAPTEFLVNNAQSFITWDFGDSLSSLDNYSIGKQTNHSYNLPGSYTVTMVSSTCEEIDTVKKQITIEAFPEINIGIDSVICSNYPIEPIIFNADAPSSTFLWQDGSTSSFYSTTVPELITVAINSSCGTVRDTAEVSGISCPCGIDLNPDITGNNFSFDIQCFLSGYEEFQFELFDIVGRKIINQKIALNENTINVSLISAGAYIYRFRTGKEIYKTGKIIIVH